MQAPLIFPQVCVGGGGRRDSHGSQDPPGTSLLLRLAKAETIDPGWELLSDDVIVPELACFCKGPQYTHWFTKLDLGRSLSLVCQ